MIDNMRHTFSENKELVLYAETLLETHIYKAEEFQDDHQEQMEEPNGGNQ